MNDRVFLRSWEGVIFRQKKWTL